MGKVFDIIAAEQKRQDTSIELIASENFTSQAVRDAVGSIMMHKYTEGYPSKRYYGGCKNFDKLELYCQEQWKKVFNTDYHCNVQPHSGSSANMAAYMSVLKVGDKVLSMSLQNGGHLTHGSHVNFSGRLYDFKFYDVRPSGYIDYAMIARLIEKEKPKLIVVGASAYSRKINYGLIKELICLHTTDTYKPLMMVDMAHIAGLVATGEHPSPFGVADIITTTTQKTLRGNRGGLIFCKPELAKSVDSAIFPCCQGGSLMNEIAGKAVTAEEAQTDDFKQYIHQTVLNAKAMAEEFVKLGYEVVTSGTDNHLFLIDLRNNHPALSGNYVQNLLDSHGITLNKNCVPNETRSPMQASGIRIGTPAMTTKGWKEQEFIACAKLIDDIIKGADMDA